MNWGAPEYLALLWGLPFIVALLSWGEHRRRRDLGKLASVVVLRRLVPASLPARHVARGVLLSAAVGMFVLAAAQPRVGYTWRELERKGIDIVVLLDVSASMDAQDVSPSRMERSRREIMDLLGQMPGDRVGLVVFAAGAYPRVPLTVDHDAIRLITRSMDTSTIRAQGSSLAGAIDLGLEMLSQANQSDRAMLLISDGETSDPEAAFKAAERAAAEDLPIFVMGVGTEEGAPIPLAGGGFKKNRAGDVVVSRLRQDVLRGVASRSGGAYVRSIASDGDTKALVEQEVHARLESGSLGTRREKIWNERFQWPLGLGCILLLAAAALDVHRRVLPVVVALSLLSPVSMAGPLEEGVQALERGDASAAVDLLTQAHLKRPQDMEITFHLGEALYRAGRFNEAERTWEGVAEGASDPQMAVMARYDMGNAAYWAGRLMDAQAHYQQALEQAQGLESAQINAEAVAKEMAARLQQQPPEDQDEGDGDSQQGGDGQPEQGQSQDEQQSSGESAQDDEGVRQPGQESEPAEEQELGDGDIELAQQESGSADQLAAAEQTGGQLSQEQAARLLEAVEEGSPRVVIGGRADGEQDW